MEITVRVPQGPEQVAVLGSAERNLKMIRESLGVNVSARDGLVRVTGERARVRAARGVLDLLNERAGLGEPMTPQQVLDTIADEAERARAWDEPLPNPFDTDRTRPDQLESIRRPEDPPADLNGKAWEDRLHVYAGGRPVRAKTDNQHIYLDAIRDHSLVFGVGPAGTGKTFLAVAAAVHMLKSGRVQRVVLARPAVEAGERLGFLPGDLEDKVNPYLRPLLDALHDMLDYPTVRRFLDTGVIEISPLAFMRGRTLNNAAIILDEAQNTTRTQMKMFLTRMGQGSRAIVTGDTTQIDLPDPTDSGLVDAARRLVRVKGVAFCQLFGQDVVRHSLVQRIVEAYGEDDAMKNAAHAGALKEALKDNPTARSDNGDAR